MTPGQFIPIQKAAAYCLHHPEITHSICEKYSRRHDLLIEALRSLGFRAKKPQGSFFVYTEAPQAVAGGPTFDTAEDFHPVLDHGENDFRRSLGRRGPVCPVSVTFQAEGEEDEQRVVEEVRRRLSDRPFIF